ncbi:RNA polymerase sigma factor [Cellulosilyticum ruminicola]|uniref:RNA polymerase sigma factor n=1 Tax=Cellulosilyticum ruminicola TaxID=425254 RepID=UPI0006D0EBC6|nr:sigma-70 family RNA polymerase sigma factor [Cellulosilyticum ruminicola]
MKEIEEMYRSYAVPVQRYILSLCGNESLAEDITADTFYKAMKNIDHFTEGKLLTWLCAIAKNTYLDYVKKKENANVSISEEMEEQFTSDHDNVEDRYVRKDERLQLYRMIYKLEPEQKEVVYLRIFGELSFKEIGEILGKSENWARVNFYRSKNRLKEWIENEK